MRWGGYDDWQPYVPVAERRAQAQRSATKLAKRQGRAVAPVELSGRKITKTFWGQAWCDNLEAYSDFANRLPRGATYVRNGSVVDLVIKPGKVEALVAGSDTYTVAIKIAPLAAAVWKKIKTDCSSSILSLLDLLGGRLSDAVMQRLTRPKDGLFPAPKEIDLSCSCPDYSACCKHIAAVMYGIGHRLDTNPELVFLLRKVDHQELVSQAVTAGNLDRELTGGAAAPGLADEDLGALFGIELETTSAAAGQAAAKQLGAKDAGNAKSEATKAGTKTTGTKKAATKKTAATKAAPKKLTTETSGRKSAEAKKAVRVKSVGKGAATKEAVEERKRRSK